MAPTPITYIAFNLNVITFKLQLMSHPVKRLIAVAKD